MWRALSALLDEHWTHTSGALMPLARFALDTGFATQEAYAFVRACRDARVMAVKGAARGAALIGTPTAVDVSRDGKRLRRGIKVFSVAVGIAKLEGDLFGLSTAVETSEESPQLAASKLLAKEVSGLQFRYYDGLSWQESWDSNALNEMPKAIEITLTLRNQEDAGDAFTGSDKDTDPYALPETTHRMVVPIPVAEPFVTESAL